MIVSLALKVEARDPGTADHCQRLSRYASTLGRTIGLCEEEIAALDRGGYLHDIGKIGIPGGVLQKRGPLTPRERTLVEHHTVIGDRLCAEPQLAATGAPDRSASSRTHGRKRLP